VKQAIVILLKPNKGVEDIRRKYVPNFGRFKPHLTLVYTFEDISQKQLNEHIKNSIKNIKPFEITLEGLKKSAKEYYLYLLVKKGKGEIVQLYKTLNTGILKYFKNKDMPRYIPHISLGVFKTKKQIDRAIKEIEKEDLKINYFINEIQLLTLKKDYSIKNIKRFKLK